MTETDAAKPGVLTRAKRAWSAWSTKKKVAVVGVAVIVLAVAGSCGEKAEKDTTDAAVTETATSVPVTETVTETAAPSPAAIQPPVTDEEVLAAFNDFIAARSEAGVMMAQSVTSVDFANGVVTVHADPSPILLELNMPGFDNNLATFFGIPAAFDDERGTRVRSAVQRVDVVDANGASLGSMSTEELHKKATGE